MGAVQVPTQQTPNELTVARCRGPKKPALKKLTLNLTMMQLYSKKNIEKKIDNSDKGRQGGREKCWFPWSLPWRVVLVGTRHGELQTRSSFQKEVERNWLLHKLLLQK